MSRRCLVLAGVFPPYGGAGAVRVVKLLKYLRLYGWEAEVVAPRGRAGWYRDDVLAAQLGSVRVHRVGPPALPGAAARLRGAAKDPHRQERGAKLLRRAMGLTRTVRDIVAVPDEQALWAAAAALEARRLLRHGRFDALLTSSFPYSAHLAGLALRRTGGPPWLAEFRDPWAGARFRGHGRGWRQRFDELAERRVIEAASAVVVVTPGMRHIIEERHGGLCGRLHVVTNGFDPDDFTHETAVRRPEKLTLAYVGSFDAEVSPPDTLLEALGAVLSREPLASHRLRFRIVGGADLVSAARIRGWLERHDAPDFIEIDPFVSHTEAVAAMRAADALALSVANDSPWVLTSKVFEYLGSGRPILAIVPQGDCRDLLLRCGGATLARPGDPGPLADAILEALACGRFEAALPRDNAVASEYAHPRIAAQLAGVLNSIVR